MGSFKFGRVADAISEGAGMMAGREAEKERERIRQQWDLKMEELRAKRQGEAQDRAFAHSETMADTAATAATARQASSDARIVSEGKLNRGQQQTQFEDKQVQAKIENMYKRIDAQNDSRQKELEAANASMADADAIAAINQKYDDKNGQTVVDFVGRMVRGKQRGFEASSLGDYSSLFQTFGVPAEMADGLAKDSGLFGDESIFEGPLAAFQDPNSAELIPKGAPVVNDRAAAGVPTTAAPQVAAPQVAAPKAGTDIPPQGGLGFVPGSDTEKDRSEIPNKVWPGIKSGAAWARDKLLYGEVPYGQ